MALREASAASTAFFFSSSVFLLQQRLPFCKLLFPVPVGGGRLPALFRRLGRLGKKLIDAQLGIVQILLLQGLLLGIGVVGVPALHKEHRLLGAEPLALGRREITLGLGEGAVIGLLGGVPLGSSLVQLLLRITIGVGIGIAHGVHGIQRGLGLDIILPGGGDAQFVRRIVGIAAAQGGALIAQLQLLQLLLGLFQLRLVTAAEDEEHIADFHRLTGLDHDRADLPGLLGLHHIVAVGSDGACAPDLGVDGAVRHILGGYLGQIAVHDGVGKEGQHQKGRKENDGGVLDPFPVFHFHLGFHFQKFLRCLLLSP